jgi:acetolactate synthase-1/2/3 large subunit
MQYTGARILIEALIEQGVDTVFGYPGGAILFIYDELFKQKDRIRHILVSHEQHAAHAADGYARSSGKTGVCIATSGPGATNLVTGIASAYMDSVPLVAITGNVSAALLGRDSFQEVDIAGVTMPIVKHNWIVQDINELAEIVREAFLVAKSGRPGPVLIDIPKDITAQKGEWTPLRQRTEKCEKSLISKRAERLEERNRKRMFTEKDVENAAELIMSAERPVVYAGGGVIAASASSALLAFAEKAVAPVAVSLMGIGAFPRSHRLYTGLIGMHGTVASNKAIQNADLVIAVGARFSDRVTSDTGTFALRAKVLHFDIDPAEINKNIGSDCAVIGDLKETLALVSRKIEKKERISWETSINQWKEEKPDSHREYRRREPLHPRFIIEETAEKLGADAVAVTDVGQHQMWSAQFFPCDRPRAFISSGGLGAMGFGLGAALGAKTANPRNPLVLFTGDGSFRMNCAEMATLTAYRIPILIIIFNNGALGMVRQWQSLFYEGRYSETDLQRPPDFVKLADAYGVAGFRAENEEEFLSALAAALEKLKTGASALIEAIISKDEMVLPMVPGGKPIHEQLL